MSESSAAERLWTAADWQEARTAQTSLTRLLTGTVQPQLALTPSDPTYMGFEAQLVEVLDTLDTVMSDQRRLLQSHGLNEPPN